MARRRALQLQAVTSNCRPVVVIREPHSDEGAGALAGVDAQIRTNPRWAEGSGASIRAAMEALRDAALEGVILMPADQPGIAARTLNRLIATHLATGRPIVATQHAGMPAYFHRTLFSDLLALKAEQDCKDLIVSNPDKTIRLDCTG